MSDSILRREYAEQLKQSYLQSGFKQGFEAGYAKAKADFERPQGNWEYLKEHITEMRDADGKLNQKQACQFILNLMGVIEREGERNE